MAASAALRGIADALSATAGGTVGGLIGGLSRDPANILRGRAVGAALGPQVVERGAEYVAGKIRSKRKTSSKQKARARTQKKAMATVQTRARKKNGKFKKGWDQSRLMRAMHSECRKLEKKKRRS
jgi:hypothetical protein